MRIGFFLSQLFIILCIIDGAVAQSLDIAGDGKADLGVFDGSFKTADTSVVCGAPGDIPVPGNYLPGAGSETAVWNPSFAVWQICAGAASFSRSWGMAGDIPVAADYNGDGLTDFAVFRPQTAEWLVAINDKGGAKASTFTTVFGKRGDAPIAFDYEGDGAVNLAVFRVSAKSNRARWFIKKSDNTIASIPFGNLGDIPVPGDYNGDGREELAVWRPADGSWYVRVNKNSTKQTQFGLLGDVPSPTDIDGDGRDDFVVYRSATSEWFSLTQAGVFQQISLGNPGARAANSSRAFVATKRAPRDFNGDGISDLMLARIAASGSVQFLLKSSNELVHSEPAVTFGTEGDVFAPGDYDGDGITDYAVVRAVKNAAEWTIRRSSVKSAAPIVVQYGLVGDQIIPADFDGDGKTNLAVIRNLPEGFKLWLPATSTGTPFDPVLWGLASDTARSADMDGDGKSDFVVIRKTLDNQLDWYIRLATGEVLDPKRFGFATDEIILADHDGDGAASIGVLRIMNGFQVFIFENSEPFVWGLAGDIALDGVHGVTAAMTRVVYRVVAGSGQFFIRDIDGSSRVVAFGAAGDLPIGAVRPRLLRGAGSSSDGVPTSSSSGGGSVAPGCNASPGTPRNFSDGAGSGALWKPVSEGGPGGAPAILLPNRYSGAKLTILGRDGSVVAGIARTSCCSNGNRAHFWANRTARQLSPFKPITVKVEKGGTTECRVVSNPESRID